MSNQYRFKFKIKYKPDRVLLDKVDEKLFDIYISTSDPTK